MDINFLKPLIWVGPIFFLFSILSCTTASSTSTSFERKDENTSRIEDNLEVTKETAMGKVKTVKKPCRSNDGSELQKKPEVEAGISKKIGSKEKNIYVEYDCGTNPPK